MKFVCDRCGKRYATAETPAPGKVYKLRCRGCGQLIVVKGQAGTATGLPVISEDEIAGATQVTGSGQTPTPQPGFAPAASRAAGPEQPAQVADDAIEQLSPGPDAAPLPPEVASAVDAAADGSAAAPAPEPEILGGGRGLLSPELTPPPPEKDELADFAAAAAEVMAAPHSPGEGGWPAVPGYRDIFGESGVARPREDSFQAAARASLPDTWSGATPTSASPPAPAPRPTPPAPAPAQSPRSGAGRLPIAVIGVGMLALVAIAVWALIGRSGPPPATFSETTETRPAAPPPPVAEVKPPPAAEPAPPAPAPRVAEPEPEPRPVERQREARAEPRPRPAERKAERKPEPRVAERKAEPARAPAAAAAERPAETPEDTRGDAATVLTQEVLNRVVGANRRAFGSCITAAGKSGLTLDGRPVALRITINGNGTVTYPTLDDQSLNAVELGQCLKSAARLMIFPQFKGDPVHYEVPLVLSN